MSKIELCYCADAPQVNIVSDCATVWAVEQFLRACNALSVPAIDGYIKDFNKRPKTGSQLTRYLSRLLPLLRSVSSAYDKFGDDLQSWREHTTFFGLPPTRISETNQSRRNHLTPDETASLLDAIYSVVCEHHNFHNAPRSVAGSLLQKLPHDCRVGRDTIKILLDRSETRQIDYPKDQSKSLLYMALGLVIHSYDFNRQLPPNIVSGTLVTLGKKYSRTINVATLESALQKAIQLPEKD